MGSNHRILIMFEFLNILNQFEVLRSTHRYTRKYIRVLCVPQMRACTMCARVKRNDSNMEQLQTNRDSARRKR